MSGIDRFLPDLLQDAVLLGSDQLRIEDLVASHLALRDTPAGDATATLVVPASLVTRLREVIDPDRDLRISLYGDTGLEGLAIARDALQDDAWISIDHVVLPLNGARRSTTDVTALLPDLSFTVPTYVELPIDDGLDASLEVIAADGAERAAFGVATPDQLGRAIAAAVRRAVPFSLDGATGPRVSALLAATAVAVRSTDVEMVKRVTEALREEDSARIALMLEGCDATAVRRLLRSVRCRSVTDAFADLESVARAGNAA